MSKIVPLEWSISQRSCTKYPGISGPNEIRKPSVLCTISLNTGRFLQLPTNLEAPHLRSEESQLQAMSITVTLHNVPRHLVMPHTQTFSTQIIPCLQTSICNQKLITIAFSSTVKCSVLKKDNTDWQIKYN